ncbi:MAG: hypothetical protein ABSD98_01805 [Candidatus Korobacteraceae bacterium]|jgi:hypothetical protein
MKLSLEAANGLRQPLFSQVCKALSSFTTSAFPAALLALLPVASFVAQYWFSVRVGTQQIMAKHLTVMIVDWVFVPFNFFVAQVIDWRRGASLYVITCISVALNAFVHAFWQHNGLDLGHMITQSGIVLPAGWVHLVFSSLETILLVAFVFCRKPSASTRAATSLAVVYFALMLVCGYEMHHALIISDVVTSLSGLFFVLLYPPLSRRSAA